MSAPDACTRIAEGFGLDETAAQDLRAFARKLGRKVKLPKTRDPFLNAKDL